MSNKYDITKENYNPRRDAWIIDGKKRSGQIKNGIITVGNFPGGLRLACIGQKPRDGKVSYCLGYFSGYCEIDEETEPKNLKASKL